jgi:hypothetical protein
VTFEGGVEARSTVDPGSATPTAGMTGQFARAPIGLDISGPVAVEMNHGDPSPFTELPGKGWLSRSTGPSRLRLVSRPAVCCEQRLLSPWPPLDGGDCGRTATNSTAPVGLPVPLTRPCARGPALRQGQGLVATRYV